MDHIIKIIIADDCPVFLEGEISLIRYLPGTKIVGTAQNGQQVLEFLREGILVDIILLGIQTPNKNGLQTLQVLKEKYPEIKVIVFSPKEEMSLQNKYILEGARAFLSKAADLTAILETVNIVITKGFYINEKIDTIVKDINKAIFSEKELEVLSLLCEGYLNKEIAEKLHKNLKTIDFHKKNIIKKTGCKNDVQIGIIAREIGIVKTKLNGNSQQEKN